MRLTTMTTYAVQAMIDLASQPHGSIVTLHEIADRQGIKAKYLERILRRLHRGGLIKSKRGPGGGYYLDRSIKEIRVGEIMTAVGESSAPVRCLSADKDDCCTRRKDCTIRPYWEKMKQTIDGFLYSSTLFDVIKSKK